MVRKQYPWVQCSRPCLSYPNSNGPRRSLGRDPEPSKTPSPARGPAPQLPKGLTPSQRGHGWDKASSPRHRVVYLEACPGTPADSAFLLLQGPGRRGSPQASAEQARRAPCPGPAGCPPHTPPSTPLLSGPRTLLGKQGSFPRDPPWWSAGWHPAGYSPPPTRPRRTSGSRWKMTTRPPLSPVASSSPVWLNSTVEMISAGGGETGRRGSLVPQCCAVQHPQRPCAPEPGHHRAAGARGVGALSRGQLPLAPPCWLQKRDLFLGLLPASLLPSRSS